MAQPKKGRNRGAPPPLPSFEGRQAWTFDSPATGAQKSNAGHKGPREAWLIAGPGARVNRPGAYFFGAAASLLTDVEPVETGAPGGCAGFPAATVGAGLAAT